MEIILKKDVDTLGHKDQIVNVKPGYANNFLIPQGVAKAATESAKKMLAEDIKQQAHKEAKRTNDANTVATKINNMTISIAAKANESGKIFGTITAADVAAQIAKQGVEIDKKDIKIENIKQIGEHKASVKIYRTIVAEPTIIVTAAE